MIIKMYISDLDETGQAKIFKCKLCGLKSGGLVMKRHLRLCGKKRVYPDDWKHSPIIEGNQKDTWRNLEGN